MTFRRAAFGLLMLAGAALAPRAADACGGCFAPPQTVQVVTDHRMVLSLSQERTVLWDQFRYSGRPEDFSWILPIRNGPGVVVEEADNLFLSAMDDVVAPLVNPPPPPPNSCGGRRGGFLFGASAGGAPSALDAAPNAGPQVSVFNERVVGPYQVVTLGADNAMALRDWLRSNGYAVPAAIEPVIDHYVSQRMDFVAVRLRPNTEVSQMKPLRVITPGYNPSLPLRMIAAGVADKVGLVLTVISASRVEAMNFPNGELRDQDLSYDYANPIPATQSFLSAFDRANRQNGSRLWLTESAATQNRFAVDQAMQTRCNFQPSADCMDGRVNPPDSQVAFQPFGAQAFVTRLRADLAATALDRDLQLAASDRGARQRTYSYGTLVNVPPDPCQSEFRGCSTRGGDGTDAVPVALALGALGLRGARRRKHSRSQ